MHSKPFVSSAGPLLALVNVSFRILESQVVTDGEGHSYRVCQIVHKDFGEEKKLHCAR